MLIINKPGKVGAQRLADFTYFFLTLQEGMKAALKVETYHQFCPDALPTGRRSRSQASTGVSRSREFNRRELQTGSGKFTAERGTRRLEAPTQAARSCPPRVGSGNSTSRAASSLRPDLSPVAWEAGFPVLE